MFSFPCLFLCFRYSCIFFKFFLDYFARFFLFETKTNSTIAKPVNFDTVFTRRTIDNIALFLWSIPSCFLIHFVFWKYECSIVWMFCLYFSLKSRDEAGEKEKHRKSKALPRNQCIIASQCTRISQSNYLLYPTYIII
jgi:hypothetical protein